MNFLQKSTAFLGKIFTKSTAFEKTGEFHHFSPEPYLLGSKDVDSR